VRQRLNRQFKESLGQETKIEQTIQ
jgi:hypothetical protein